MPRLVDNHCRPATGDTVKTVGRALLQPQRASKVSYGIRRGEHFPNANYCQPISANLWSPFVYIQYFDCHLFARTFPSGFPLYQNPWYRVLSWSYIPLSSLTGKATSPTTKFPYRQNHRSVNHVPHTKPSAQFFNDHRKFSYNSVRNIYLLPNCCHGVTFALHHHLCHVYSPII